MKTTIKTLAALAAVTMAAAMTLTACQKGNPGPEPPQTPAFVAVTDITGLPGAATVGTALTLAGTVAPDNATNKTIAWSVKGAGTTGATISGTTFNATAAGTAVLTATVKNGKTATTDYTKDFSVSITTPTVAVTGVSLDKTTLALVEGADETLTATVAPEAASNKAVTWTSSAPAIATVDAATGKVTAVKAGTATITATSEADATITATCAVTVAPKPVPVITITTQPTAPVGLVEGSIPAATTLTVAATVTHGATLKYQWFTYYADEAHNAMDNPWEKLDGATAEKIYLPPTLAAGDHWYVCEISAEGAESKQTDPVKVTVNDILYTDSGVTIEGVTWATRNVGETPGTFAATPEEEGGIYDFHAAQTVCPAGWRTPSLPEAEALSSMAERAEPTSNGGLAFTVAGQAIVMAPTSFRKYYWTNEEDLSCGWEYSMDIVNRFITVIAAGGDQSVGMVRCVRE